MTLNGEVTELLVIVNTHIACGIVNYFYSTSSIDSNMTLLRVRTSLKRHNYLVEIQSGVADFQITEQHLSTPLNSLKLSEAILQAQQCLGVLPGNKAAAAELKAIQGFLQLQDLGLDLPPLQFHQVKAALNFKVQRNFRDALSPRI